MKRSFAVVVIMLIMAFCVGCGPYGDYSGTYVKSDSDGTTYTITLSSSGSFRFERKFSDKSSMHGTIIDNDKNNIREGTFTVDDGKITINYKVYDMAMDKYTDAVSTAKLSGGKLTVSRTDAYSDVYGTFTKR